MGPRHPWGRSSPGALRTVGRCSRDSGGTGGGILAHSAAPGARPGAPGRDAPSGARSGDSFVGAPRRLGHCHGCRCAEQSRERSYETPSTAAARRSRNAGHRGHRPACPKPAQPSAPGERRPVGSGAAGQYAPRQGRDRARRGRGRGRTPGRAASPRADPQAGRAAGAAAPMEALAARWWRSHMPPPLPRRRRRRQPARRAMAPARPAAPAAAALLAMLLAAAAAPAAARRITYDSERAGVASRMGESEGGRVGGWVGQGAGQGVSVGARGVEHEWNIAASTAGGDASTCVCSGVWACQSGPPAAMLCGPHLRHRLHAQPLVHQEQTRTAVAAPGAARQRGPAAAVARESAGARPVPTCPRATAVPP
jgi:hypothetical protein